MIQGATNWTIESNLRGASIDLPPPLRKAAAEPVAFRLERRPLPGEPARDTIVAQFGEGVRVVAERRGNGQDAAVERALVLLGRAAAKGAQPERPGIALRGDVAKLDADAWLAVVRTDERRAGARPEPALELGAIDLDAGELVVFGRRFEQAKVSARRGAAGWQATVDSRPLEGTVTWTPAGEGHANGRLSARFARFNLAAAEAVGARAAAAAAPPARTDERANPWPELDVTADRFIGRAGDLGATDRRHASVGVLCRQNVGRGFGEGLRVRHRPHQSAGVEKDTHVSAPA